MSKIKVFISHASDAEEECDLIKNIIREETENHFSEDGYEFKPKCWRDILPGLGRPQEGKIDPVIADSNCRLVIILLKNKLGTAQRDGKTGIEHEYNFAKRLSKDIWVYDCDFIIKQRRSEIKAEQLAKVTGFIQQVKREGLIRRVPSSDDLPRIFRSDLTQWARKLIINESDLSKYPSKGDFKQYSRGF